MNIDIKIRPAIASDELAIAKVHIRSWQEAYKGLISKDYLDSLDSKLNERIEMWKSILSNPKRWAWVAEGSNGIVGFILFGPPRDPNREDYIELGAVYLLESNKNKGIGFSLLSAGFNKMRDLGYKKAYCWVLEGNPTIKFYERSGAKFSNQVKQDDIGGETFNELAYDWDSLNIGDYNWQPLSVEELKNTLSNFNCQWWVAGGWAIDLFIGRQTRKHDDIDILIQRQDQLEIQKHLADWDLWAADPPGTLRPWSKGDFLGSGLQDIWGRKTPKDPWQIQIMLFDVQKEEWVFKRDESIRRNLRTIAVQSGGGLQLLAPEIQLLYKSKSVRPKDQQDFEAVIQTMSTEQKDWLKQTLQKVYKKDHPWIKNL